MQETKRTNTGYFYQLISEPNYLCPMLQHKIIAKLRTISAIGTITKDTNKLLAINDTRQSPPATEKTVAHFIAFFTNIKSFLSNQYRIQVFNVSCYRKDMQWHK